MTFIVGFLEKCKLFQHVEKSEDCCQENIYKKASEHNMRNA